MKACPGGEEGHTAGNLNVKEISEAVRQDPGLCSDTASLPQTVQSVVVTEGDSVNYEETIDKVSHGYNLTTTDETTPASYTYDEEIWESTGDVE